MDGIEPSSPPYESGAWSHLRYIGIDADELYNTGIVADELYHIGMIQQFLFILRNLVFITSAQAAFFFERSRSGFEPEALALSASMLPTTPSVQFSILWLL